VQVDPPKWKDSFTPFTEWLQAHTRGAILRERAARKCHSYRLRFLFNYWYFFYGRNAALRRAWAAAISHHDLLLKWTCFIAFKVAARIAHRERDHKRRVLRQWHAVIRSTLADRQITLSQLLVRLIMPMSQED
jgi:hypothetical protein